MGLNVQQGSGGRLTDGSAGHAVVRGADGRRRGHDEADALRRHVVRVALQCNDFSERFPTVWRNFRFDAAQIWVALWVRPLASKIHPCNPPPLSFRQSGSRAPSPKGVTVP